MKTNMRDRWHALPVWKQTALSVPLLPLLPLIAVSVVVVAILGLLLSFAMSCIDNALDIIYKDKP